MAIPTPPDIAAPGALSRRAAFGLLALLVAANLALGFDHLRHGLPHVFHADSMQIGQAAGLIRNGWYADDFSYPPALAFVYAGAARVAFGLELLGISFAGEPSAAAAAAGGWRSFAERFQDTTLQHAIGRVVSVLAGGLLVIATYRLARLRFSRAVALLAAAVIAVDPVLVITEHQVRPHVPMAAAMLLAAPTMLRLAERGGASVWRALLAGVAAGLVASVLQLGALLAAAGAVLVLLLVRPLRRAVLLSAAVGAGLLATAWTISALFRATGMVRPVLVRAPMEDVATLALPGQMLELGLWRRFPISLVDWLAAAPVLFLGVLVFALLCWRRRASRRDLLLYGSPPLLILLVMETVFGGQVRYLVETAPFLAVLAAAACFRLRPGPGIALAALLVLQPLAGSLRYEALLDTRNTRVALDALIAAVNGQPDERPLAIAVQDRIALDPRALPTGAFVFPDDRNLKLREEQTRAMSKALRRSGAEVYARMPGVEQALGPLDAPTLELRGFHLYGTIHAAPPGRLSLPDVPDHIVTDLWRSTRTGPTIEMWVTGDEAAARLRAIAAPQALDAWTSDPANVDGGGANPEPRARRALPRTSLLDVLCDIDGDGRPDIVASNVNAEGLAQLLALPADRWRDAGGATVAADATDAAGSAAVADTATSGAPRLAARGTLLKGDPLLLLLTGAAPRAAVRLIVGTSELRARFADAVMVPVPEVVLTGLATGPTGAMALGATWPQGIPIGFSLILQCWIDDPAAPRHVTASNAVAGTTPG